VCVCCCCCCCTPAKTSATISAQPAINVGCRETSCDATSKICTTREHHHQHRDQHHHHTQHQHQLKRHQPTNTNARAQTPLLPLPSPPSLTPPLAPTNQPTNHARYRVDWYSARRTPWHSQRHCQRGRVLPLQAQLRALRAPIKRDGDRGRRRRHHGSCPRGHLHASVFQEVLWVDAVVGWRHY
jgi:hypothetical protein